MPAAGAQTTRNIRGFGSNGKATSATAEHDAISYRGAKMHRIWWTLSNGETITPGSGGVPNGVVGMAWEPYVTGQSGNVFFDRSTRLGTAVAGGSYAGFLLVWSRRA